MELDAADRHRVAGLEHVALDAASVDERAVRAAEILDDQLIRLELLQEGFIPEALDEFMGTTDRSKAWRSDTGRYLRWLLCGPSAGQLVFIEELGGGITDTTEALGNWAVVAVSHDVGDLGEVGGSAAQ